MGVAKTLTELLIVGAWLLVMVGAILTSGLSIQQGEGVFPVPTLTGVGTLPLAVMGGATAVVVIALLATDLAFR